MIDTHAGRNNTRRCVCVCSRVDENCLPHTLPSSGIAVRGGVSAFIHTAERGGSTGPTHYTTTVTPIHYTHAPRVCVQSIGTVVGSCA